MKRQQGVVLVIALIALVAMSLAGISLMRTVDTTNVISGNMAFNEAAIQMEDVGEEQAYNWIIGNPYSNPSG
ncbi:MAG: pilus assembly PilX family protein, partial [Burkholderiales bacterium]